MDIARPGLRNFDSFFEESRKFHSEVDRMWAEMQADVFKHRPLSMRLRDEKDADERRAASLLEPRRLRSHVGQLWDEMQTSVFSDRPLTRKLKEEKQMADVKESDHTAADGSFKVSVSVTDFKPEELVVKVIEDTLVIEANHKEQDEKTGRFRQQHFAQRFALPKSCDKEWLTSSLSTDGVLTVSAPSKAIEAASSK